MDKPTMQEFESYLKDSGIELIAPQKRLAEVLFNAMDEDLQVYATLPRGGKRYLLTVMQNFLSEKYPINEDQIKKHYEGINPNSNYKAWK